MGKAKEHINEKLLAFSIIEKAAHGDVESINDVLAHYSRYINSLATVRTIDENGNKYTVIDEKLRRRIETKLIVKILGFKVA